LSRGFVAGRSVCGFVDVRGFAPLGDEELVYGGNWVVADCLDALGSGLGEEPAGTVFTESDAMVAFWS
jgi:hypothetical protein